MDYTIVQPANSKGRAFQAHRVAMVLGHLFDESKHPDNLRPLWAMFAGSDTELRPFLANLRGGKRAETSGKRDDRIEFLKSVGYAVTMQREAEGCLATIYHPELFKIDPGMVDKSIRFAMLVPRDWSEAQELDRESAVTHVKALQVGDMPLDNDELLRLVPAACLFVAYLDRRTRAPIVPELRFHLQLLLTALDRGLATRAADGDRYYHNERGEWGRGAFGFKGTGLADANISDAIAFSATQESFETFLADQTAIYMKVKR